MKALDSDPKYASAWYNLGNGGGGTEAHGHQAHLGRDQLLNLSSQSSIAQYYSVCVYYHSIPVANALTTA